MKSPRRETLAREGERLLAEWGVGADASAAELTGWIGRGPASDLAIVHRLGSLTDAESVALLRRIAEQSADKDVTREVRRSLYRLAQRGIEVPPEQPAPGPAPVLSTPPEGYLSPVDGRGDQLLWLVKRRPGGLGTLFAVVNDPRGLHEIDFSITTRKRLKSLRASLAKEHEVHLVEADWRYCDFLIYRAFRWAQSRNAPMKGDYAAQRAQLLKEPPPEDMPPLVLSKLDAHAIRADDRLVATSEELLHEKELGTWILDEETIRPYLEELQGIKDSPLVLSEVQQKDRFEACVARAVVELFDGERREIYTRRLQEMAYFLLVTDREEQARRALAVSFALSQSSNGGSGIPFCEALARGSVALWSSVAEEQETQQRKSSLVVTPRQFAAEQQKRHLS